VYKIALKSISSEPYLLQCASNYARDITLGSIEFVIFYLYLVVLVLLFLSWRFFKANRERTSQELEASSFDNIPGISHDKEKGKIALEEVDDCDLDLTMHGYAPSAFGEVAKASLYVTSAILLLIMVVLTLDYYSAFAIFTNKGAAFMLFNNHETLSVLFVAMWHITTFWFLGFKVFILLA
jgi:hypothetical protein